LTETSPQTARERLEAEGKLSPRVVGAIVDGDVYDLLTPLPEGAAKVAPLDKSAPAALKLIRHSSAHVMADAVQRLFPGTKVAFGPATDAGFYYDYDRGGATFSDDDLRAIEAKMSEIIAENRPFVRQAVSRDEAREVLTKLDEPYKLEHLERLEGDISLYRHGDWVDLCEGPHVPSTGFLEAFQLTHVSGSYWRGDERNPMLQRIYGTAFASAKDLRAHINRLEEAKQRDHRKLAKELGLVSELFGAEAAASEFHLRVG